MKDDVIKIVVASLLFVAHEAIPEVSYPESLEEYADKVRIAKSIIFGSYTPVLRRDNLQSVFNTLNGNQSNKHYRPVPINTKGDCNYPTNEECSCDYSSLAEYINQKLSGMEFNEDWLNRLIEYLEVETSYIPGTLNAPDISLFDQAKMCAAVASCLVQRESVDNPSEEFLLYSMDFSGIQDFIYTINSKGALKTLRARSFYLEILMENCVDQLLCNLELTRANLIYSGGGHSYLLIPNTDSVKEAVEDYNCYLNNWLLETYDISLYVAHGYAACSGEMLQNEPQESYKDIFRTVSKNISSRKASRYTASQLLNLNNRNHEDYSRECKVCRRIDKLDDSNECSICSTIKKLSSSILKDNFFGVLRHSDEGVPLPGDMRLVSGGNFERLSVKDPDNVVRVYRKRQQDDSLHNSIGLWIGDYSSARNTLAEMAEDAQKAGRIERIGVIRADIDNLGSTFALGFDKQGGGNLMRTAALSRQLSLFFKNYINYILGHKNPNVTICYSGGDDLFIIGEWYDLLESSVDIRKAFEQYTDGTLTISGGVGIYDSNYPISRIAYETEVMEDRSKHYPGKDALTLFEDNTYHWDEYEDKVVGEKLKVIKEFFDVASSRGNSFLYKLLDLIRNQSEKINFARYVYLLSRLEPGKNDSQQEKDAYRVFSENMTKWIKTEEDRRQLITAIQLYVYMTRNKEE